MHFPARLPLFLPSLARRYDVTTQSRSREFAATQVNGDRQCEGDSGRRIYKLGRRQRRTRNTIEKWWGTAWMYMQGGEGKFSSHRARAWAFTLTPKEYPRLRIRAAPGFSVLVLGFQPRLLGNRTVTSRTDVTTDTTARATPDQSSTWG